MGIVVLMAVTGITCAAFYLQAKTARRAKNNTMRLLAEANAEKQQMISDIRVLVSPAFVQVSPHRQSSYAKVVVKWQLEFGQLERVNK
jgi:hypothetical protein